MIRKVYIDYKEIILYVFYGILTVCINTLIFLILYKDMEELAANTIAFLIAVQFAYMTNTKFVFSKKYTKENLSKFWSMRIGTIFIDNGIMYLFLNLNVAAGYAKVFSNIVIIVLNYLCSKFIIFQDRGENL